MLDIAQCQDAINQMISNDTELLVRQILFWNRTFQFPNGSCCARHKLNGWDAGPCIGIFPQPSGLKYSNFIKA